MQSNRKLLMVFADCLLCSVQISSVCDESNSPKMNFPSLAAVYSELFAEAKRRAPSTEIKHKRDVADKDKTVDR